MRKIFLMLLSFLPLLAVAKPKQKGGKISEKKMAGYVMVYHKDADHGLHMAYSWDGYAWTALNDDRPIIAGDTIAEQKGIRDPFIFRGPDGGFCVAMTDLHIYAKREGYRTTEWERDGRKYDWGNNRGLVLMKSFDLINWTRTNLDFSKLTSPTGAFNPDGSPISWEDVGCVWAPEMTIDDRDGRIMMHFTTRFMRGRNQIYYAYMNDDFNAMVTEPKFLFGAAKDENGNLKSNMIDSDIIKIGDTYHMFAVENGMPKHATSDCITGPYVIDPSYKDGETKAHEAPNVWKLIGKDKWILMFDNYSRQPHNFGFLETTDFKTFTPLGYFDDPDCPMKRTNFSEQKHGAVVQVTKSELKKLISHWSK